MQQFAKPTAATLHIPITACLTLLYAALSLSFIAVIAGSAGAQQVFNVPSDVPPKEIGANTIVNILPGADVPGLLNVNDGGVVDMSGGRVGNVLHANNGSTVTVSGGNVSSALRAFDGSTLVVSGGTVGELAVREGSNVTVRGYEFRIDGMTVSGLNTVGSSLDINVATGSLFSGSLEDGTPFAYLGANLAEQFTLLRTTAPSLPPSITVSSETDLLGVGAGQTLTLTDGGKLPENFNAGRDSEVLIQGGFVGRNFEAVASHVTVNAGKMDVDFQAYQDTVVDVNGGFFVGKLRALKGSTVNVNGGEIGSGLFNRVEESMFNVFGGSASRFTVDNAQLNLFGGSYVDAAIHGSDVDVRGGTYGDLRIDSSNIAVRGGTLEGDFWASNSDITLYGSNFLLNGRPVEGLINPGDSVELMTANNDLLDAVIVGGDELRFSIVNRRPPGPTVTASADSRFTLVYAVPEPTAVLLSMTAVVHTLLCTRCRRRYF